MVFHPCFSPSIHCRPSGVLSIFWPHDQVGLGGPVYLLLRLRSKGGKDIFFVSCGVTLWAGVSLSRDNETKNPRRSATLCLAATKEIYVPGTDWESEISWTVLGRARCPTKPRLTCKTRFTIPTMNRMFLIPRPFPFHSLEPNLNLNVENSVCEQFDCRNHPIAKGGPNMCGSPGILSTSLYFH